MKRIYWLAAILAVPSPSSHAQSSVPGHPNVQSPASSVTGDEVARWKARFASGAFQAASGSVLPYRIAKPSNRSRRPLVLVLHGSRAIGNDNQQQLGLFAAAWAQLLADHEDAPIIVVPQVAARSADYQLCHDSPCASKPGPSFDALLQLLDDFAASKEVDPRRIFVVGFSMGGSAGLQLALARPQKIAGMTLFAPVPPPVDRSAELSQVALAVIHGTDDRENPFAVMRDWMAALEANGGEAEFIIRDGLSHQVPDDMLVDPHWRRRLLDRGRPKRPARRLGKTAG